MKPRTQLVLLAAGTLILAIASTAWWLSSPQGVRRAGEAIVLLVATVSGLGHIRSQIRRLPWRSPVVLCTSLVGLGVVLFARPTEPPFAIALAAVVGLAWTGVFVVRSAGPYVRRKTGDRVLAGGGRWITSSR